MLFVSIGDRGKAMENGHIERICFIKSFLQAWFYCFVHCLHSNPNMFVFPLQWLCLYDIKTLLSLLENNQHDQVRVMKTIWRSPWMYKWVILYVWPQPEFWTWPSKPSIFFICIWCHAIPTKNLINNL